MAIAYRASSHISGVIASTAAGTKPTGTVSSDVLIAYLYWDNSAGSVSAVPSGWTQIDSGTETATTLGFATYWALGSVSSLTWTFTASTSRGLLIAAYSGADTTAPISAHSLHFANAATVTTTAITVPANNWFLCGFSAWTLNAQAWTTPTGLSARTTDGSSGATFDSNAIDAGSKTAASNYNGGSQSIGGAAIALAPVATTLVSASDAASVTELAVSAPPSSVGLRTYGGSIVDQNASPVRLKGASWYGAESTDFCVGGLQVAPIASIADRVASLGLNCIRLLWSNQAVETNPLIPSYAITAEPSLAGLRWFDMMDAVISALTSRGIMVVLDNHVSDAIWCCSDTDGNTLWYTLSYPESAWIADWQTMATRYASNSLVVGAELRNEPRTIATWGTQSGVSRHGVSSLGQVSNTGSTFTIPFTTTQPAPGTKVVATIWGGTTATPNPTLSVVHDNCSSQNAFTVAKTEQISGQFGDVWIAYLDLPETATWTGNYTITVTMSATGYFSGGAVNYWGVANGAPTFTNAGTATSGTTASSGSVAPTSAGLYIGALADNSGSNPSPVAPTAPFTDNFEWLNGTANIVGAFSDYIGTGTQTASWAITTTAWASAIVYWPAADTDWQAAAQRGGNAVLTSNSNLLVIVDGVNYATDLSGVASNPVVLNTPNRVVYTAHDYGWDETDTDYPTWYSAIESRWGYLVDGANPLPFWLGEFGTNNTPSTGVASNSPGDYGWWFRFLTAFINQYGVSYSYWDLNGTESTGSGRTFGATDTFGLLAANWYDLASNLLYSRITTPFVGSGMAPAGAALGVASLGALTLGAPAQVPTLVSASDSASVTEGESTVIIGGATPVTGSDSASASEAPRVAITAAETASGVEAISRVASSVGDIATSSEAVTRVAPSVADAAGGVEASSGLSIATSDTATGAEAVTGEYASATDAATGVDSASRIAVTTSDLASVSESAAVVVTVLASGSDSATGVDATSRAALTSSDVSSGADASSGIATARADVASGADAASAPTILAADSASGTETSGLAATASDAATGSESAIVTRLIATSDLAAASDVTTALAASTADIGAATEAASVAVTASDSSTISDAVTGEYASVTEAAVAVEATSLAVSAADAGSATEAGAVGFIVASSDAATVSESIAGITGSASDSAAIAEASGAGLSLTDSATVTEFATGSDQTSNVSASDTASSTDASAQGPAPTQTVAVTEGASVGVSASDAVSVAEAVVGEYANVPETATVFEATAVAIGLAESATTSESASVIHGIGSGDAATASESVALAVSRTDSASAADASSIWVAGTDQTTIIESAAPSTTASETAATAEASALGTAHAEAASVTDASSVTVASADSAVATDVAGEPSISLAETGASVEAAAIAISTSESASVADHGDSSSPGLANDADAAGVVESVSVATATADAATAATGTALSIEDGDGALGAVSAALSLSGADDVSGADGAAGTALEAGDGATGTDAALDVGPLVAEAAALAEATTTALHTGDSASQLDEYAGPALEAGDAANVAESAFITIPITASDGAAVGEATTNALAVGDAAASVGDVLVVVAVADGGTAVEATLAPMLAVSESAAIDELALHTIPGGAKPVEPATLIILASPGRATVTANSGDATTLYSGGRGSVRLTDAGTTTVKEE